MALTFDDNQAAALLETLGLPADTSDIDTALATVKDAVAGAPSVEDAQPSAIAAAAKRAGLEVVDADSIAALRHDAAEGRRIKAAAEQQRIEASVDTAINKGKITPGRKKHWIDLITADPGMADVLAGVPDETAVPLTEIGHGVDGDGPAKSGPEWFH